MKWMKVVDVISGNTDNFENCIYMLRNKINEKLYVGQSKNFVRRTKEHKYRAYNKNSKREYNYPIHCAIRKYGLENFEICILEKDLNDYNEMDDKEIYYIEYFDTLASNNKGYNLSDGGGNGNPYAGKTEEEMKEFRRKISKIHKGKKGYWYGKNLSEETKRKMSEATKGKYTGENNPMYGRTGENNPMYGKKHSKETRQKMSEAQKGEKHPMYGKHHSEESKQKMSEAHKGKQHPEHSERMKGENNPRARKVILLNTGETFDFIKQASEKYKVADTSISACCRGKCKSCGKLNGEKMVWLYLDDFENLTQEEIDELKNFISNGK